MMVTSEKEISELSRSEKAQLLQWLIKDLGDDFAGIESRPNVCGGAACIVRTGISVWVLENARRQGITESELLQDYPSLTAQNWQTTGLSSALTVKKLNARLSKLKKIVLPKVLV